MICLWLANVVYYSPNALWRPIHNGLTANNIMQTIEESIVTQKTQELCQAILDEPAAKSARQQIEAFMSDATARNQYETLMNKGQALQEKQQQSQPLSDVEVADFEKQREELLNNPVARGFLDAQETFHDLQHSIQKCVSKTIELGRMPSAEELQGGCCGGGGHECGCGH